MQFTLVEAVTLAIFFMSAFTIAVVAVYWPIRSYILRRAEEEEYKNMMKNAGGYINNAKYRV